MAEADVTKVVSAILAKCLYPRSAVDRIKREFAEVRTVFRSLLPREQSLGNSHAVIGGVLKDVIALDGVLQVAYSGRTYNVPVRVCLLHGFPNEVPRVSVVPTASMRLASHHSYMSEDGIVRIPVMSRWNSGVCLVSLLTDLIDVFSQEMPVFTKSSAVRPSSVEANRRKMGVVREGRLDASANIPSKSAEVQPPDSQRRIAELEKGKREFEATARTLAEVKSQLKAAISQSEAEEARAVASLLSLQQIKEDCEPLAGMQDSDFVGLLKARSAELIPVEARIEALEETANFIAETQRFDQSTVRALKSLYAELFWQQLKKLKCRF